MYSERAEKALQEYTRNRLQYADKAKGKGGEIYSCDKVQLVFRLRYGEAQRLLDTLASAMWVEFAQWESRKLGTYRNQFSIKLPGGNSFWLGVGLSTPDKPRLSDDAKLEFNPNKVGNAPALHWVLLQLWRRAKAREGCTVKAWDLAVDYPVERTAMRLQRGAGLYEEYTRSASDTTQYTGQRNAPGRCKLYNKTMESKLADTVTRLELTLPGGITADGVAEMWPTVYRLVNVQFDTVMAGLNDTDRFIFATLLREPDRLKELGRRKRASMTELLNRAGYDVRPDFVAVDAICKAVAEYAVRHEMADSASGVPSWGMGCIWPDGRPFAAITAERWNELTKTGK